MAIGLILASLAIACFTGLLKGEEEVDWGDRFGPDRASAPCYQGGARRWGFGMKARQLIAGASYGPAALKAVGLAFDGVWAEIAQHFHDPLEIEAARLRLASTVLELVNQAGQDPEELKTLALQAMALTYRRLRGPGPPASTETPPDGA